MFTATGKVNISSREIDRSFYRLKKKKLINDVIWRDIHIPVVDNGTLTESPKKNKV